MPLIFILTMEPLLRGIKANPDIKGIHIKHKHYKLAAYADDILLFLSDPLTSIPNLLKDLTLFKSLSNLQINFSKSKALNITLPSTTVTHCQANFPFEWEPHAITYLDIQIPKNLSNLYSRNFSPLLQSIQQDLQRWNTGLFSWFGRASIIKMNILPRFLYLFQTLPIRIPATFFKTYKRLCRNFIWSSKAPRLRWDRLTLPKSRGGIGLPDVYKYHWSCLLTRVIDWHIHTDNKDWIKLEESFVGFLISHLPWISQKTIPKECTDHPLIHATILHFRMACNKRNTASSPGPLTPIEQNPDFPPGLVNSTIEIPRRLPFFRAEHFFHNVEFSTYATLTSRFPEQTIPFFKYLQVRHFIQSSKPLTKWHREYTTFKTMYSLLFLDCSPKSNAISQRWEKELSLDLTLNGSRSLNTFIKDPSMYLHKKTDTSYILDGTGPQLEYINTTPAFPHSAGDVIYLKVLYSTYGGSAHSYNLSGRKYTASPPAYKKSLTLHLINAAKQCIPMFWRQTNPPTTYHWFCRIDRIAEIEVLIHQARENPTKFQKTWACWSHFKETADYCNSLH